MQTHACHSSILSFQRYWLLERHRESALKTLTKSNLSSLGRVYIALETSISSLFPIFHRPTRSACDTSELTFDWPVGPAVCDSSTQDELLDGVLAVQEK
ncbi:MAG TPA: hypothetical protein DEF45_18340 [Rhodopirellula sp.]|nr:hypothetical protein [Rhodopirellula sp.]